MTEAPSVLRFDGEGGDFVEVALAQMADDDLLLSVQVSRSGFGGTVETWVHRQAWIDFANALERLEHTRQGEARLPGLEATELELRVASVDRAGHIAISGMLCLTGDDVVRLEFSAIRFDPSQLMVALRAMRTFG